MPENDFLPFAVGSTANVEAQSTYAADSVLQSGFQSGVANSAQVNKVLRQASIMASMIAQFTVDHSGQPAIDNGTTATLEANLLAAITAIISAFVANALGAGGIAYSPQFASVSANACDDGGNGGQMRLIGGNYGVILRNDGTAFDILATPAGATQGGWAPLYPFSINLATGVVTIDSTQVGTNFGGLVSVPSIRVSNNATVSGQVTAGSLDVTGSATIAGALSVPQIGATTFTGSPIAPTPVTGTRTNQVATTAMFANEFPINGSLNGYTILCNGLILQWGTVSLPTGQATVSFPIAFQHQIFGITSNDVGNAGASNANITSCAQSTTMPLAQFNAYAYGRTSGVPAGTVVFYMALGF